MVITSWNRLADIPVPQDSHFLLACERKWVWLVTTSRDGYRFMPWRGVIFLQGISGPDDDGSEPPEGVSELQATHWARLPEIRYPGVEEGS